MVHPEQGEKESRILRPSMFLDCRKNSSGRRGRCSDDSSCRRHVEVT